MTEIHLDPVGGIAGDMFVAAMLDVRPDLEKDLHATLARCPLIEGVTCKVAKHNDGILTGRRFLVAREDDPPALHRHHHGHGHHHHHHDERHADDVSHDHVEWRHIRTALEDSSLEPATVTHAIGIFSLLAEAEARVHGREPDAVSFHEVGAWDSIADIVGAAHLIAAVGASRWTAGPVPLGSGRVRTAHGILPVPAPATALLLEGFATIDDGIGGERVTPTGAAILRYLCARPSLSPQPRRLVASGHGFGTRTLPGISNCLRALAFEAGAADPEMADDVTVIEFEIDDQTSEDLAQAIDRLRAHAGVLDLIQAPVFGKKGRMMAHVRILARPEALDAVAALIFDETTTIGIRHQQVRRMTLPRRAGELTIGAGSYKIKTVDRPGGATTKVEADDLSDVAGRRNRVAIRSQAEEKR